MVATDLVRFALRVAGSCGLVHMRTAAIRPPRVDEVAMAHILFAVAVVAVPYLGAVVERRFIEAVTAPRRFFEVARGPSIYRAAVAMGRSI